MRLPLSDARRGRLAERRRGVLGARDHSPPDVFGFAAFSFPTRRYSRRPIRTPPSSHSASSSSSSSHQLSYTAVNQLLERFIDATGVVASSVLERRDDVGSSSRSRSMEPSDVREIADALFRVPSIPIQSERQLRALVLLRDTYGWRGDILVDSHSSNAELLCAEADRRQFNFVMY